MSAEGAETLTGTAQLEDVKGTDEVALFFGRDAAALLDHLQPCCTSVDAVPSPAEAEEAAGDSSPASGLASS